ncbi:rhodanese-related sulfurtransferase [Pontivivens nitratireducens]|uniref:oxygen-dependent tRNA uridine(34) hydroxylase TrhO n=1 Tax=Pontivivens nitratireducens TaxID=2758038 RepID=UPI001639C444|nr:rhodanese-related sulfurtransferase [Pontibrevibacter nitratireducens]
MDTFKANKIAALYRFARIEHPELLRDRLDDTLSKLNIRGILLVASEGINGTLAGSEAAIDAAIAHLRAIPGCEGVQPKYSFSDVQPFRRLRVRLKQEIVTLGAGEVDPNAAVGRYVAPQDWNDLIADPDVVLIDTRNDYEVAVGSFEGALDPGTRSFGEFPEWWRRNAAQFEGKKVAMFCTGGIRCEKSTSWLIGQGVEEVYHLQGGILKYLEDMPEEQSTWQGECFVFDERVTVGHGLKPGPHVLCAGCRRPLAPDDLTRNGYERGVSCHHCIDERTPEDRARFRERQRQIDLAAARGEAHLTGQKPES